MGVSGALAQARSILAKVADHSDPEITRACFAVLGCPAAEEVERGDAAALLERVPACLIIRLAAEAGVPLPAPSPPATGNNHVAA
jgi:hypothetical protein